MDIKIHLFSSSTSIGKTVYFVYKTSKEEGYVCASLEWSRYLMGKYRLFDAKNKMIDKFIGDFKYIPYDEINDVIKKVIKRESNIDVNNITFCNMNKLNNFIKNTKEYVYGSAS